MVDGQSSSEGAQLIRCVGTNECVSERIVRSVHSGLGGWTRKTKNVRDSERLLAFAGDRAEHDLFDNAFLLLRGHGS